MWMGSATSRSSWSLRRAGSCSASALRRAVCGHTAMRERGRRLRSRAGQGGAGHNKGSRAEWSGAEQSRASGARRARRRISAFAAARGSRVERRVKQPPVLLRRRRCRQRGHGRADLLSVLWARRRGEAGGGVDMTYTMNTAGLGGVSQHGSGETWALRQRGGIAFSRTEESQGSMRAARPGASAGLTLGHGAVCQQAPGRGQEACG